jgi:hypothetical protein
MNLNIKISFMNIVEENKMEKSSFSDTHRKNWVNGEGVVNCWVGCDGFGEHSMTKSNKRIGRMF